MTDSYQKTEKLSTRRRQVIDPLFGRTWIREHIDGPNKDKDLHGYYCKQPFTHFEVKEDGKVHLCCPSYLPYVPGNINEKSIEEIWNGEPALELRRSILNGEYNYCSRVTCPAIQNNTLKKVDYIIDITKKYPDLISDGKIGFDEIKVITKVYNEGIDKLTDEELKIPLPTHINLSEDKSCNLHCPSCRVKKIMYKSGTKFNRAKNLNDKLVEAFLTTPTDRFFTINCCGSGDPFASKIYRNMLYNINGNDFPNLKIDIQTNGLLFTKTMWNKLHKIHNNLRRCEISFDAGTKETYEQKTRLGGNWDILLKNCDFLDNKSKDFIQFNIKYHYVVQVTNYKEMPICIKLILDRFQNFEKIQFVLVNDWNTWSKEEFESQCMWKTTHPEHEQFLEVLRDPIFDHPKVDIGNLTESRRIAINHES